VAQTTAIYYRDKRGTEPVDRFIDALPAKRAAKIDDYIEEHFIVLLHAFAKDTGAVPATERATAKRRMADFKRRMDAKPRVPPRAAGQDAPSGSRRRG
jgi:hypothetical protein